MKWSEWFASFSLHKETNQLLSLNTRAVGYGCAAQLHSLTFHFILIKVNKERIVSFIID